MVTVVFGKGTSSEGSRCVSITGVIISGSVFANPLSSPVEVIIGPLSCVIFASEGVTGSGGVTSSGGVTGRFTRGVNWSTGVFDSGMVSGVVP